MNRYLKFALPLALVCTLISTGLFALYGLVISMHALDPVAQLPFFYFQKLNFPALAVALPIVGMVGLLPYALRLAFAKEPVEAVAPVVVPAIKPGVETPYLKAA